MMASRVAPWLGVLGLGAGGGILLNSVEPHCSGDEGGAVVSLGSVPPRTAQLSTLARSRSTAPFDVLVIGGGATGCGIALDAAARGLRTALVEREDFGSGTSSKSTKLVHGGVRYLEKAVFGADLGQLKLVYEALQERRGLLDNAPHLTSELPILMPCYRWWEVPLYWTGLKLYDAIAGSRALAWSSFLSPAESARRLPTLSREAQDGARLKGAILYYDGQFDDARLNVALATTAAAAGAAVANYVEAASLIKDGRGQVVGASCRDQLNGKRFDVHAKVVINAAGPFVDSVRRLGQPDAKPAVTGSSGAHVTLPDWYGSVGTGLIVPKTKDGRVIFLLPWQGVLIAGTTDTPCVITDRPAASATDVAFILDALRDHLSVPVRPDDLLAAWAGIRPLAADPTAVPGSTSAISRDHVIFADSDGLVTVTGGKWTTYRRMAEDAVDAALETGKLSFARPCVTSQLRLLGAGGYGPTLHTHLAQQLSSALPQGAAGAGRGNAATAAAAPPPPGAVARHLATAYGDQSSSVLALAESEGLSALLVPGHPVLEAEVVYACRHEYCATVEDFLSRRTRLAYLDVKAARAAVPRVTALMAQEHRWGGWRRRAEERRAHAYLDTFEVPALPRASVVAAAQSA